MGKGFGGMDFGKMMKQAQKMQAEVAKLQEEIASRTVEATAGGGAIKVKVTGAREVQDIVIDESALDDVELLQDLIIVAINEGLRQAEEMMQEEMGKLTQGLGLPPGLI